MKWEGEKQKEAKSQEREIYLSGDRGTYREATEKGVKHENTGQGFRKDIYKYSL